MKLSIHKNGPSFELQSSTEIDRPIEEVFEFFANAENLQKITPRFVGFSILSPLPIKMHVGTVIDYRISIRKLPLKWRTEITEWNPPHSFQDTQIRGPYRQWVHQHRFTSVSGGTRVEDVVQYKVLGGRIINRLFVQKDVLKIFRYRNKQLAHLLGHRETKIASSQA